MIEPVIYIAQPQGAHLRKMDLDKRRADKVPMLNHKHIKIGKAEDFYNRRKDYQKTFGKDIKIEKVLQMWDGEKLKFIEKQIKERLKPYRHINEKTGRRIPEWYIGISYDDVKDVILEFKNYYGVFEVKDQIVYPRSRTTKVPVFEWK